MLPIIFLSLAPIAFVIYQWYQFKKGNDQHVAWWATFLVFAIAWGFAFTLIMERLGYWA